MLKQILKRSTFPHLKIFRSFYPHVPKSLRNTKTKTQIHIRKTNYHDDSLTCESHIAKSKYHCDFCSKPLHTCRDKDADNVTDACRNNDIAFVQKYLSCPRFKWFFRDRYGEFFVTSCFSGSIEIAQIIYTGSSKHGFLCQNDFEYALINAIDKNNKNILEWLETLPELNNQDVRISLAHRALFFEINENLRKYLEVKKDLHYLNLVNKIVR